MSAHVVMYTTDYCPYCFRAKRLLAGKGVGFDEVDVSDRPELRQWLVEASKQRTVPQIFINGQSIGGFDELAALQRRGVLDGLLAQEPKSGAAPLPR